MPVRERRTVRTSLFHPGSRKYWALKDDFARLLFVVFLCSADDEGRLEGETDDVKSLIPRSKKPLPDVEAAIDDLAENGMIHLYSVRGKRYIEIVRFVEMQYWHGISERSAEFPAPRVPTKKKPSEHQQPTVGTPPDFSSPSYSTERNSLEKKRTEGGRGDARGEPSADEGIGTYKNFATRYYVVAGRSPGHQKKFTAQYAKLCEGYGETKVLDMLAEWAEGRGGKGRLSGNGYAPGDFLFREGPAMLEGKAEADSEEAASEPHAMPALVPRSRQ